MNANVIENTLLDIECPVCKDTRSFFVQKGVLIRNKTGESRFRLKLVCGNCAAQILYFKDADENKTILIGRNPHDVEENGGEAAIL